MRKQQGALAHLGYWLVSLSVIVGISLFFLFGVRFNAVLSNSMAPQHPAGSVVVTIQKATDELGEGAVVKLPLPNGSGQSYIHRVVDVLPNGRSTTVMTKGDNNVAQDPWSLEIHSPTTPVVVATIPLIGHFTSFTSNIWVQLLLASIAVSFVSIALVRAFWRPQRDDGLPQHRTAEPMADL
jgi:signal peptidase I